MKISFPHILKAAPEEADPGPYAPEVNAYLLDHLAPSRVADARDALEVGETVRDVHVVRDFPPEVGVDRFRARR